MVSNSNARMVFCLCVMDWVGWGAALQDKEASRAASLAIRHLCDASGALMAPYLDNLISLYQRVQASGAAGVGPDGLDIGEDDVLLVRLAKRSWQFHVVLWVRDICACNQIMTSRRLRSAWRA